MILVTGGTGYIGSHMCVALAQANEFEQQLAADGTVVVKFWLHVSREEQKRRIRAWAKDEHQRWRAELARGRREHGRKETLRVVEEVLARTHAAPRLKPPFNAEARRAAGFSQAEIEYLLGPA